MAKPQIVEPPESELDDGRMAHLQRHDVVIQNGTRHAWRNQSDEPTVMAFVLIGARRQP